AGGGVRAAAWTALVTNCAFGSQPDDECHRPAALGDPWSALFAASGASGGSVGLASVIAEHLSTTSEKGWVLDRLGTDLLSPSVAWQLLVEAPLVLPRIAPGMDRAEVLERTWSRRWGGSAAVCRDPDGDALNPGDLPLRSLWPADAGRSWCAPRLPLFFPNGTSLTDGCRFNVSMFDAAPDDINCGAARQWTEEVSPRFAVTRDLVDFLCTDEDVRLSTAAFLSARFPFVSPTGRVASPELRGREKDPPCGTEESGQVAFVGDGGYKDNTGASALLELWDSVRGQVEAANRGQGPCVVPVFVEINNGYIDRRAPSSGGRLAESVGPFAGAVGVFAKRDSAGPELASALFADEVRTSDGGSLKKFVSFALAPHPGVQAPLGWSLSESSKADLLRQLSEERNRLALEHLYKLLTPGLLRCP
ncbi:MAG: hypothetical protein M3144_04320, partial [Actinomycetota bacterium]|nr:hypothetical protein [Actinomycetota bacterium]